MILGEVCNESLRWARRGEVGGRVEKRRRNSAAIVAFIGEVIGRRVEVRTWSKDFQKGVSCNSGVESGGCGVVA